MNYQYNDLTNKIMFEKEENRKENYSEEELKKMIEMKVEISEENKAIEISEELRDEIVAYLYNRFEIKGLEEGKKFSLYFYNSDLHSNGLYLSALESEIPFAWFVEDEEIINEIEELISKK